MRMRAPCFAVSSSHAPSNARCTACRSFETSAGGGRHLHAASSANAARAAVRRSSAARSSVDISSSYGASAHPMSHDDLKLLWESKLQAFMCCVVSRAIAICTGALSSSTHEWQNSYVRFMCSASIQDPARTYLGKGVHAGRRRLCRKAEEDVASSAHEAGQQHQAAGCLLAGASQLSSGQVVNKLCRCTSKVTMWQPSKVPEETANMSQQIGASDANGTRQDHLAAVPGRS